MSKSNIVGWLCLCAIAAEQQAMTVRVIPFLTVQVRVLVVQLLMVIVVLSLLTTTTADRRLLLSVCKLFCNSKWN